MLSHLFVCRDIELFGSIVYHSILFYQHQQIYSEPFIFCTLCLSFTLSSYVFICLVYTQPDSSQDKRSAKLAPAGPGIGKAAGRGIIQAVGTVPQGMISFFFGLCSVLYLQGDPG